MNALAEELIKTALETGVLKFDRDNPFLWASGFYMPVYNDNRLFLKKKKYRQMIAVAFAEIIRDEGLDPDVIAGTATAGIPHAAALADLLDKPLVYVRSIPKDHGLGNRIEGISRGESFKGRSVLLIEDLVSTGGSSVKAVKALREAGGDADCCLSIFSYGFREAASAFGALEPPCSTYSIITYDDLIPEAERRGYITEKEAESLREWREAPFEWKGDRR